MRLRVNVCLFFVAVATLNFAPIAASAQGSVTPSGIASLVVAPHRGGESVDVTGRGQASSSLTITLVSTFSLDLPDVVISRTTVNTDAGGAYSATISIAPGYMRGSILTVYATAPAGGSGAQAQYLPDAPNLGVIVPSDQLPKNVR